MKSEATLMDWLTVIGFALAAGAFAMGIIANMRLDKAGAPQLGDPDKRIMEQK